MTRLSYFTISQGLTLYIVIAREPGTANTSDDREEHVVQAGVPLGSLFRPLLWSIMYDGELRQQLPIGCTVVDFADANAIVSFATTVRELEEKVNATIWIVRA